MNLHEWVKIKACVIAKVIILLFIFILQETQIIIAKNINFNVNIMMRKT